MTAMCAARNILGAHYDLWAINTEPDYQEEKQAEVDQRIKEALREPARPAYAEPPRIEKIARGATSSD